jgi:hypothetical protein
MEQKMLPQRRVLQYDADSSNNCAAQVGPSD